MRPGDAPLAALEVNGAALVGATARGVLFNEPGVAVADRRGARFGREAAAEARRDPARSYDNYWEMLSEDPLPRPMPGFRSYADLAHGQLRELWRRFGRSAEAIDGVVLAIPAGAGEDRLALLLGICEEAGLPVAGLVESAVAAVRAIPANRYCLHIEATAERIAVSRLEERGGRVHAEEVLFNGRPGLRHLRAAMTAYAAGCFVAASRFDPLELPATEQELAGQLDGWLSSAMAAGELKAELSGAPIPAAATLRKDDLAAALERQLAALGNRLRSWCSGPQAAEVQLSGALAAAPACAAVFARLLSREVQALPPGAAALGAVARFRPASGSPERYVLLRSLPAVGSPDAASGAAGFEAVAAPAADGAGGNGRPPLPTHMVLGGRAWRIGEAGLGIGSAPQPGSRAVVLPPEAGVSRNHCTVALENGQAVLHDHSRYGTRLNGAPVAESAPLRAGDVVGVGRSEFLVTCEVGGNGA